MTVHGEQAIKLLQSGCLSTIDLEELTIILTAYGYTVLPRESLV